MIIICQVPNAPKVPASGWKCQVADCGLEENLWLNLSDGSIFCGRRQFITTDVIMAGNEHAKKHYQKFVGIV